MNPLWITLYNLKEQLHHQLTDQDIDLIKNTNLFNLMDEKNFSEMLKSIRSIKYPANKILFHEGEQGDVFYIITEGSVRVFTHDTKGEKIPIARLNKGAYFGEQALLGQANKTRNADIETITETTLIYIDEKFITQLLQIDTSLKARLQRYGIEQALNILSLSTELYSELDAVVSQVNNPTLMEIANGEVIFNVGDKPDNVYIVIQGEVKLLLPEKNTGKFLNLKLHKGHLFGELGVIQNKPRAATAVADGNVRLLVISSEHFKSYVSQSEGLQKVLASLKQMYQIPMKGTVEQYLGNIKGIGESITSIYKMEDGRSVIATKIVNQPIFTLSVANITGDKRYLYQRGQNKIKIDVKDNRLTGIKVFGICDDLPTLCGVLLDNQTIAEEKLTAFSSTGTLNGSKIVESVGGEKIICECMSVTRKQIQDQMDKGIRDLESIALATGAATSCKGCVPQILQILGINPWLTAVMSRVDLHNSYISSFLLKPTVSHFNSFNPGQHVVIQVKMNDLWIERPYTISDIERDGSLRITIKKEPKGYFTQWLYDNVDKEFTISVSQPQGNFVFNLDEHNHAVCFAGGIGVTPFITFAKVLSTTSNNKRVHLLYSALTQEDFVFTDEFNEISNVLPSFTITYRASNTEGLLTEEEVIKLVLSFNKPEVYICGPEGFVRMVQNALQKIRYNPQKIHIEKFIHAGETQK